jgi:hypothetical protein
MIALVALIATALMVLALPLLLLKLAFQVVFTLIALPFKLVGLVLGLVFGVVGFVFRVLFSAAGLIFGLLAAVVFLVVLPLLPFVLLGLGIWLIVRQPGRPRCSLSVA